MNIKNYTSTVDAARSMNKIEDLLVEIGATNINKQYTDKICTGITFLLFDNQLQRTLSFHLKAEIEECFHVLWRNIKRAKPETRESVRHQASRTAWKILCDLTEMQCTTILLGQAKPLQLFLPFIYDVKTSETLFDKISNGKVKLLQG